MTTNNSVRTLIFLIFSVTFSGCGQVDETHNLPEINEENCKTENIKNLDKKIQQEFGSKCFRRNNFQKSESQKW